MSRALTTSMPPRSADYWVIALSMAAQAWSSSNEKALTAGLDNSPARGGPATGFSVRANAGVEVLDALPRRSQT